MVTNLLAVETAKSPAVMLDGIWVRDHPNPPIILVRVWPVFDLMHCLFSRLSVASPTKTIGLVSCETSGTLSVDRRTSALDQTMFYRSTKR